MRSTKLNYLLISPELKRNKSKAVNTNNSYLVVLNYYLCTSFSLNLSSVFILLLLLLFILYQLLIYKTQNPTAQATSRIVRFGRFADSNKEFKHQGKLSAFFFDLEKLI